mgnify:CR=1 FL=1
MERVDLLRFPWMRSLLRHRAFQFGLALLALVGLWLVILAGLFGTQVGNHNLSIVLVWIAWWGAFMLVGVPLFGRGWCSICPIALPGEWLQRGALLAPQGRGLGLGKRWPRPLRNAWLQNGIFVFVALFSMPILTQPRLTAVALIALLVLAMATSLIFERRAFCRYLCPLGGFIGLYAQLAPLEVRVRDATICAKHQEKSCYLGNSEGYGCPWQVFPPNLIKNTSCGLCIECLRVCPYENIALNLRPFGTDLAVRHGRRLDEAYKALLLLGSVLFYTASFLGPWGGLKSAAYSVGRLPWFVYAMAFLLAILVVIPALFGLAVWLGRYWLGNSETMRSVYIQQAYALLPLGLASWIAFSLSLISGNFSYVVATLSDPMGWGWNLFGTTGRPWIPWMTNITPFLQIGVLVSGVVWSGLTSRRIAAEQLVEPQVTRQSFAVVSFCVLIALILMRLLTA